MIAGRKPNVVPVAPEGGSHPLPRCPAHLDGAARNEWRRLAGPLHKAGVLTTADRAAFAAYCQAYSRWVEAEEQLKTGPKLIKTRTGYVQQSPWLSIANKQLELMGRFMAELGLTPSARSRLQVSPGGGNDPLSVVREIKFVTRYQDPPDGDDLSTDRQGPVITTIEP